MRAIRLVTIAAAGWLFAFGGGGGAFAQDVCSVLLVSAQREDGVHQGALAMSDTIRTLTQQGREAAVTAQTADLAQLDAFIGALRTQLAEYRRQMQAMPEGDDRAAVAEVMGYSQAMLDYLVDVSTRRNLGQDPAPAYVRFQQRTASYLALPDAYRTRASEALRRAEDLRAQMRQNQCSGMADPTSRVDLTEARQGNSGHWASSFGLLNVTIEDGRFSAVMADGQSRIEGVIQGDQLAGTYILSAAATSPGGQFAIMPNCPDPYQGAQVWGRITGRVARNGYGRIVGFSGDYAYCDNQPGGVEALRFSGTWQSPP